MPQIAFYFPNNSTVIIFHKNVIDHLTSYIQFPKDKKSESGGQLFSNNPNDKKIVIDKITGPYESDQSGRCHWSPDTKMMSLDRILLFEKQYYIVGLWHTHPEGYPSSSYKDKETCEKHLDLLEENYNGFLLITMGYKSMLVEYLDRTTKQWYMLKKVESSL